MAKEIYNPSKPFNDEIRALIKSTHPSKGPIKVSPFGKRFMVDRDPEYWKDFSELTGTDGIGTKGLLHWQMNTLNYGVQDAFAMVVDDLIEGGFVPVMLQNHIMMQEEDPGKILTAIKSLVELCIGNKWEYAEGKSNPIIISGGETAPINTMQGFEMGITGTGYARKGEEIQYDARPGDLVIGLASSGVHSNGLSFYREEFFQKRKMGLNNELPWGVTIGEELTKPTDIYLPAIKALIKSLKTEEKVPAGKAIHGMVHITGGGLSKLRELTPKKNTDIEISNTHNLGPQEIFRYAHDEFGVPSEKMYKRFNNGIGYVIAIDPSYSKHALGILRKHFKAEVIGEVRSGTGKITIESVYDSSMVAYQ
ncbi:MAG TPA: AIR synthase-related protein [Candidatus Saccharimonadales bacterium]|nr:AIR synthase-related protein [Candidatus Saccharimonadales bacterium]